MGRGRGGGGCGAAVGAGPGGVVGAGTGRGASRRAGSRRAGFVRSLRFGRGRGRARLRIRWGGGAATGLGAASGAPSSLGSRGAGGARRGQATARARTARTAAARPAFPQRTRMAPGRGSGAGARPRVASIDRRMATEPSVYDLVLLLDTQVDEERRTQILDNVQAAIEKSGDLVGRHDWGVRPTVYEVQKRADADYHLIQFHGDVALLEQLDHTLKITDGVLRFRIIKLRAGTPPPPDLGSPAAAAVAPAAEPDEA